MNLQDRKSRPPLIHDDEIFERMRLGERLQHGVLVVSFIILVITGMPIFLYQMPIFNWLFSVEGSFWIRGILHRIAAVGLIGVSIYHAIWVLTTQRGRETFLALLPVKKDLTDAFESLMYNLGLTVWLYRRGHLVQFFNTRPNLLFLNPPRYGRYNYIEKFEYLAVVWGNLVMIGTGFMLWYPVVSAKFFPMWVHEIFRLMHGFEALLAMLAIAIWHMYNVHFSPEVFPMSKIWLTGKLTGEELRLGHPLEYEQIWAERERRLTPDALQPQNHSE